MRKMRALVLGTVLASALVGSVTFFGPMTSTAKAALFRRQYYATWSYRPSYSYYYRSYYYKPYSSYSGYKYHYCVYYPSRPRYVYYYNPYRKVYWGRYDLESQGYSELAQKDRKEKLEDIPDKAFPKPGAMPKVPEAEDNIKIEQISKDDLPKGDVPKDAPGGSKK